MTVFRKNIDSDYLCDCCCHGSHECAGLDVLLCPIDHSLLMYEESVDERKRIKEFEDKPVLIWSGGTDGDTNSKGHRELMFWAGVDFWRSSVKNNKLFDIDPSDEIKMQIANYLEKYDLRFDFYVLRFGFYRELMHKSLDGFSDEDKCKLAAAALEKRIVDEIMAED